MSFAPPQPVHASTPPSRVNRQLLTASHVFVRCDGHVPPLEALYTGHFLVLQRSDKTFHLQVGSRTDNVSVDRLKPCLSSVPVVPQQPPRRGRPPRPPAPAAFPPASKRPRGRPKKFKRLSVFFVLQLLSLLLVEPATAEELGLPPPLCPCSIPVNPETCTPARNLQLVYIICLVFFCHPYIAHTR